MEFLLAIYWYRILKLLAKIQELFVEKKIP